MIWFSFSSQIKNTSPYHLPALCNKALLNYDDAAAEQFTKLRQLRLKIGTMDLKIAAIAISIDALLLSRNLKDFHKISSLRVEDWAA